MQAINIYVILGVVIGGALGIAGLFRPFLGFIVLMTLHFVQPGEFVPLLMPLRIELVYGILMVLVLLRTRAGEIKAVFKTDPVVRATVLLELVVVATIPFAIWRGGAFDAATELFKILILQLLMTIFIDSQVRLRHILWLLTGFMMWFAGSAFIAYINGQYYTVNGVQRAEGLNSMVGGPNELAGFLLVFLPFLVALIHCSKNSLVKALLIGCGVLTLFVLLLTGARIAAIALLAMILFYILRSRRRILNMAIALVLGITLWFSLPEQYQKRYLTVKQYAEGGKLDDSNKLRLEVWDAGWRMFLDHPILGVGAGQFPTAYGMVYSGNRHGAWMQPHNLLLQIACELGIVGLLAFAYFVFQISKAVREVLRTRDSPGMEVNYQFAVSCSFMLIGITLISTVSHTLYRPYWYLLAGLVAANRGIARSLVLSETKTLSPSPEEQVDLTSFSAYRPLE